MTEPTADKARRAYEEITAEAPLEVPAWSGLHQIERAHLVRFAEAILSNERREDRELVAIQITKAIEAERERCAQLHESVSPASDDERLRGDPGAGAMGAVIEYRDLIRGD